MGTSETTTPDGRRVAVGQVWADNDWRARGRTVRVIAIENNKVVVETITGAGGRPAPNRNRTKIMVSRLRPNSTGYRMISEPTVVEP